PGMLSRYCKGRFLKKFDENDPKEFLEDLLDAGAEIGGRSILIPTSDETALFVAEYADRLSERFIFQRNSAEMVRKLISKKEMYEVVQKHQVPTPFTLFPNNLEEAAAYAEKAVFPVMLKGILGNRLQARTRKKMVIVRSKEELIENYKRLEDPNFPNLMLQEYIPGGDDQVYIFNGYFNKESECLAGFTGYKIRQFPTHVGCASLGETVWNKEVADLTTRFMRSIRYQGILDIGYRFDARDGRYKVLDINPRIGQAFRLFLAENGMDVARALYLDLTGQKPYPIVPLEKRRWVIEDYDIISSIHYYQEGTLRFGEWIRSFRNVEEGAWFHWKDPLPFFWMLSGLLKRALLWLGKRLRLVKGEG
ncbi:MAG TPA: hypothetical protein VIK48_03810, partial [Candidatus Manganitrophaceae bacterium]